MNDKVSKCMPKISILMSTYNPNEELLKKSLDSIQSQTFKNFELILVDDGSSNCDIEEILSSYSFDYIIIKNEHNLGLPSALNVGMQHCRGEYIARMDDDDIMRPNRLQTQLEYAENNDGIIFCKADRINSDGNMLSCIDINCDIKTYLKKSGNCLTHSSLFLRRQILIEVGGYNSKFIYAQDYELYMRLINDYDFYQIDEKLILYRIPDNISFTKKVLSPIFCYAASVIYFSKNKSAKNTMYFFRRSIGLVRKMFWLIKNN